MPLGICRLVVQPLLLPVSSYHDIKNNGMLAVNFILVNELTAERYGVLKYFELNGSASGEKCC